VIDLHTHVLPGIDDGARDLAEAIAMCRLAAADGCQVLVATPHQYHPAWPNEDRRPIVEAFEVLRAAVAGTVELRLGAEVRVDSSLLDEVERLPGGSVLPLGTCDPLAPSKSLLLELERLPPTAHSDVTSLLHELLVAGWQPILAHPELIPWLLADRPLLADLVARGAWLQVTASAVTGDLGRGLQQATLGLIDTGWVQVVASDCHGVARRPPGLSRAHAVLSRSFGADVAHALTTANPARALGLPLTVAAAC
jgi:protein-tyrosine phosphatase